MKWCSFSIKIPSNVFVEMPISNHFLIFSGQHIRIWFYTCPYRGQLKIQSNISMLLSIVQNPIQCVGESIFLCVYLNSEGFYVFVVQSLRALIPLYICCCVERLDCRLDYISSFMDQSGSFSFVFGFRTLALAWMRGMRGECPSLPERMLIGSCLYQK